MKTSAETALGETAFTMDRRIVGERLKLQKY